MSYLPSRDIDHVLAHTAGLWDAFRGESLFLTGGTGFVGTWLLETFLTANERFGLRARIVVLNRDPACFLRPARQITGRHAFEFARAFSSASECLKRQFGNITYPASEQVIATSCGITVTGDLDTTS
jgi:hypothetical protein